MHLNVSSAHAYARFNRYRSGWFQVLGSRKSEQIQNSQPTNMSNMSNYKLIKCVYYSNILQSWMSFRCKNSPASRSHWWRQCLWGSTDLNLFSFARGWAEGTTSTCSILFIHFFKFQVPTVWSANGICENHRQLCANWWTLDWYWLSVPIHPTTVNVLLRMARHEKT